VRTKNALKSLHNTGRRFDIDASARERFRILPPARFNEIPPEAISAHEKMRLMVSAKEMIARWPDMAAPEVAVEEAA
jgi:hypothetical protein